MMPMYGQVGDNAPPFVPDKSKSLNADSEITLFVYGTLREPLPRSECITIPGAMYDIGAFPGVKLKLDGSDGHFYAERKIIRAAELKGFDDYEGYDPEHPEGSLYLRVPFMDGYIYEYNQDVTGCPRIESGDWSQHRKGRVKLCYA